MPLLPLQLCMHPAAAVFVRGEKEIREGTGEQPGGGEKDLSTRGHQAVGGIGEGAAKGRKGSTQGREGKKISITGHETRRSCFNGTGRPRGMPTGERGRPARTIFGTVLAISSTRVDRQRRLDSASAEPRPFPPAGGPGATSQGNRAARNGSACGRDARAPGWGLLPSLLLLKGSRAGFRGRGPWRCSRAVTLAGPLCNFVDRPFGITGACVRPPPDRPSPFGSTSPTPPQGGSDTSFLNDVLRNWGAGRPRSRVGIPGGAPRAVGATPSRFAPWRISSGRG